MESMQMWLYTNMMYTTVTSQGSTVFFSPSSSHSFVYCCHGLYKTLPGNRCAQLSKVWGQKCVMMWILTRSSLPPWANKTKPTVDKPTQYRQAAYSPVYPGSKWVWSRGSTHWALWSSFTFTSTGVITVAQTQKVAYGNSANMSEKCLFSVMEPYANMELQRLVGSEI